MFSKGKNDRKKMVFLKFFDKKLLTWTSPKNIVFVVFELPLLRNAQKRHKNPKIEKKIERELPTYLPTPFSGYLTDIRRF
jgi:hypothetical protein